MSNLILALMDLKQIAADIQCIKSDKGTVDNILERLSTIELKLDEIGKVSMLVEECNKEISGLEAKVQSLEMKVDDLENRSRRNNIVIYGLSEDVDETPASLLSKVVERFFGRLGVTLTSIERVHRLGRRIQSKHRAVILRLFNYSEKTTVFNNCFKLKGSSISITEDFSKSVRIVRKKLWDSAVENRWKGDKVSLHFMKLRINNEFFTWDSEQNKRVPVNSTRSDN
ncbi:uncharacterized protein LOC135384515 [Ornithodoros turicata]|uniref:uncharacterized protein LOC135384515 n=1 Tax=Ornithodoros turicata TaxID=34597 RepID=UPI003139E764